MAPDEPRDDPDGEDREAPLGDLVDRIRTRERDDDATAVPPSDDEAEGFGLDEFFQDGTTTESASEDIWEAFDSGIELGPGVEVGEEPNEHIVPKRSYCENCPKDAFSKPPEVNCSHPGTSILEFVDSDHVLVRNCPVVAERQALGETDDGRMTPGTFGSQ